MPNRGRLADLTTIWTAEGWLYLAAVLDLGTRQIVGWVQFAAKPYRPRLRTQGMLCSMSRKGDCWDNAPMESKRWLGALLVFGGGG